MAGFSDLPRMMIKIIHCITGLSADGAQGMLLRLVQALSSRGFANEVVSLQRREPMAERFEEIGVPVLSLGCVTPATSLHAIRHLARSLRCSKPHILQGWMYHAHIAITLARGLMSKRPPLIWNIRRGLDDLQKRSWKTIGAIQINRAFSALPSQIIYCSTQSRGQHEALGFVAQRGLVLGNGFDTQRFKPNSQAGRKLRAQLKLEEDALILGHVGRFDPAKGHALLIDAFSRVIDRHPHARLVCIGRGVDQSNGDLTALIAERNVSAHVSLLGENGAVEDLYSAFDVLVSSSIAEGFPNVVAEAMASGVPCVVTDTGASSEIVGETGEVVSRGSAEELAHGLIRMMDRDTADRRNLGLRARERIESRFVLSRVADRYAELYRDLAAHSWDLPVKTIG